MRKLASSMKGSVYPAPAQRDARKSEARCSRPFFSGHVTHMHNLNHPRSYMYEHRCMCRRRSTMAAQGIYSALSRDVPDHAPRLYTLLFLSVFPSLSLSSPFFFLPPPLPLSLYRSSYSRLRSYRPHRAKSWLTGPCREFTGVSYRHTGTSVPVCMYVYGAHASACDTRRANRTRWSGTESV